MAAPETTVWDLEPHTRAKHEILKRYLQAWTPILTQGRFPEIMYIDGFAGPGRYSQGEDGSPVIALKAALPWAKRTGAIIRFLFIERDRDRAQVLRECVGEINPPSNLQVEIAGGVTFEKAFGDTLNSYKARGASLPPTFAFIDPFGWTGVPFSAVKTIMKHRSCEVLITFMYEEINRFISNPDQEENFDALFGAPA